MGVTCPACKGEGRFKNPPHYLALYTICSLCRGSGHIGGNCTCCAGTGMLKNNSNSIERGEKERCPNCGGSGG